MRKIITLTLLVTAAVLRADTIDPSSYTLNTAAYGWAQDSVPQKLTNKSLAADFLPPGQLAIAYNTGFVGFNANSDITFNFAGSVNITNVTLHGVRWTNAAVEVPAQVKINNADTFTFTQADFTNHARYTLSFVSLTGWTGSSLNLYATTFNGSYASEWMLFDEVTFTTGNPSSSSVPDSGSSLVLCGASLGALAIFRRRQMTR